MSVDGRTADDRVAQLIKDDDGGAESDPLEEPPAARSKEQQFLIPPSGKETEFLNRELMEFIQQQRKVLEDMQSSQGAARLETEAEPEISQSELEAKMQFLSASIQLQTKEREILELQQRLAQEKSKVNRTADIKPTKFNGKGDLEDYLTQFLAIAKFHGWSDEKKVVILMSKLEGEALSVAAVLREPTFSQLVKQLKENFSCEQQELAAIKLQNRVQLKDESLESLALDIQKLTRYAYVAADERTRNFMARNSFVEAILDPYIRDKLRDKNLPTLQECLQEARRVKANLEVEKNRNKDSLPSGQVSDKKSKRETSFSDIDQSDQIRRLRQDLDRLQIRNVRGKNQTHCRSRPPSRQSRNIQSQRRVPTCYKCTMIGHISKYCPFPDEVITTWIQEGLIGTPKSRQEPKSFSSTSFKPFNPSENAGGQPSRGPTSPY